MKARGGKALLAFCTVFIALAVWAGMTWASPPVEKAKIPLVVVKAAEKDAQGRDLIGTYADIDGGIMVYELRYDDGEKVLQTEFAELVLMAGEHLAVGRQGGQALPVQFQPA